MSLSDCPGLAIWGEHIHQSTRIKALDDDFEARYAAALKADALDGEQPCPVCERPMAARNESGVCGKCARTAAGRRAMERIVGPICTHCRHPRGETEDCPQCARHRSGNTHCACGEKLGGNNHSGLCGACRKKRNDRARRAAQRERS